MPDTPNPKETAWAVDTFFGRENRFEVYNPDTLVSRKGRDIYDKMLLDPQVKSAFYLLLDMITSRKYRFEKTEDTEQQKNIETFFKYNIEEFFKGEWTQALRAILMAKAYGFSITEKIWKVANYEGKSRWLIQSLKFKDPYTFLFYQDRYGNLVKLEQENNSKLLRLDPNKFIIFVNNPERHHLFGESDLRSVYRPYWEKDNLLKFWNIYLERLAGGFILAKPNERAGALNPTERADFERVLERISHGTSMRAPSGYDVELIQGIDTDAFENSIRHRDSQIARGLLVPNLLGFSEQGVAGSFSQSKVHLELFMQIVAIQCNLLSDVLNEQLFRELAEVNFGVDDFPKFTFDAMTDDKKIQMAEKWMEAVQSGTVLNTYDDEMRTRKLLGYDIREEDGEIPVPPMPPQDNTTSINEQSFLEKQSQNFKHFEDNFSLGSDFIEEATDNYKEDYALSKSTKSEINHKIRGWMKSAYEMGREDAKAVLGQHISNKPRALRNELETAISLSKRFIIGVERGNEVGYSWSIKEFMEANSLESSEKYYSSKGFWITGLLEDLLVGCKKLDIENYQDEVNAQINETIHPLISTGMRDAYKQAQLSVYLNPRLEDFVCGFTGNDVHQQKQLFAKAKQDMITSNYQYFICDTETNILPITSVESVCS